MNENIYYDRVSDGVELSPEEQALQDAIKMKHFKEMQKQQRIKNIPEGTDLYYELREPNKESIPDLSRVKDLDIWDLLGD